MHYDIADWATGCYVHGGKLNKMRAIASAVATRLKFAGGVPGPGCMVLYLLVTPAGVKVTLMEKRWTAEILPPTAPITPVVGYGLRREHDADPPVLRGNPVVAGGRAGLSDLVAQVTAPRDLQVVGAVDSSADPLGRHR
jgi:hypothetical protein